MSWEDRLIEAAYTSPSGIRMEFLYEDVSNHFNKKTTAFEFTDADGTFIQDNGKTGSRYPLTVIFSGPDYDIEANEFIELIKENGTGKLEHPMYGIVSVVPFGKVQRADKLKTSGNQAHITVEFWETLLNAFPTAFGSPVDNVASALDSYSSTAPEAFDLKIDVRKPSEQASFDNTMKAYIGVSRIELQPVADTSPTIAGAFSRIYEAINNDLDTFNDVLSAGFQTIVWLQGPSRSIARIQDKLKAYDNLLQYIIDQGTATLSVGDDNRTANTFFVASLFASTFITGSVNSALYNTFETKPQALEAAGKLMNQLDRYVVWRDENYEALGEIDTGEDYQELQDMVALAAGFLVELSFNLKQEYTITLNRARTVVDLEAELYGTVDENLDFLITTNSLTGDEILELPRGREIVYYV